MRVAYLLLLLTCIWNVAADEESSLLLELTQETFDEGIAQGKWLVKFYAPWCSHCKRLAPVLDEAVLALGDTVRLARVDATTNKGLKGRFGVTAFPKLVYFEDGKSIEEYEGPRELDEILRYCSKRGEPPVVELKSEKPLLQDSPTRLISSSPVSFVLSTKGASKQVIEDVAKVAAELQSSHHFFSVNDDTLLQKLCKDCKSPVLFRYEVDEGLQQFNVQEKYFRKELKDWVTSMTFPVFAEVTSKNFRQMLTMKSRKLVLALYRGQDDPQDIEEYLSYIHSLARNYISTDHSQFVFVHADGVLQEEFALDYEIEESDLPRTLILDFKNDVFYDDTEDWKKVEQYLKDIVSGAAPFKRDGMYRAPYRIRRYLLARPIVGGITVTLFTISFSLLCYMACCVLPQVGDDNDSDIDFPETTEDDKVTYGKPKPKVDKKKD